MQKVAEAAGESQAAHLKRAEASLRVHEFNIVSSSLRTQANASESAQPAPQTPLAPVNQKSYNEATSDTLLMTSS